MRICNYTTFSINTALAESVIEYPTDDLLVEIKYCRDGTRRYASGTYYRRTARREDGKLIRVRINARNRYPLDIHFKTSNYTRETDDKGQTVVRQMLRRVTIRNPEDLILAIFLHEFSHYLDHIEGRNGSYKQTKADKFALSVLHRLGIIEGVG